MAAAGGSGAVWSCTACGKIFRPQGGILDRLAAGFYVSCRSKVCTGRKRPFERCEVRQDDGKWYTKSEFIEFYGDTEGEACWRQAPGPEPGDRAGIAGTQQRHRRLDSRAPPAVPARPPSVVRGGQPQPARPAGATRQPRQSAPAPVSAPAPPAAESEGEEEEEEEEEESGISWGFLEEEEEEEEGEEEKEEEGGIFSDIMQRIARFGTAPTAVPAASTACAASEASRAPAAPVAASVAVPGDLRGSAKAEPPAGPSSAESAPGEGVAWCCTQCGSREVLLRAPLEATIVSALCMSEACNGVVRGFAPRSAGMGTVSSAPPAMPAPPDTAAVPGGRGGAAGPRGDVDKPGEGSGRGLVGSAVTNLFAGVAGMLGTEVSPAARVEEWRLGLCAAHDKRVACVCKEAGCASVMLCRECVLQGAHQGHDIQELGEAFLPTKEAMRAQLATVQAELGEARRREGRAVVALRQVADNFNREQAAVQLYFSTAVLACEEGDQRCGVAEDEEFLRVQLQAQEAYARKRQLRARQHLQQQERLVRCGLAAGNTLLQEKHQRLFSAREHVILSNYIKQRAALEAGLEEALALSEKLPCTLQHRSARLTGLCAGGAVPADCPVSDSAPSVRMLVQAPAVYRTNTQDVCGVALSPCGRLCCASSTGGSVSVYDTITAEQVAHVQHGTTAIKCVVFSRCGKRLAATSLDMTVAVFCTAKWVCMHVLEGHTQPAYTAAWACSGRLVTGSQDGSLRLWDVGSGVCSAVCEESTSALFITLAISDSSIFATAPNHKAIHEWDATTLQHTHSLEGHTSCVPQIALTADSKQLVSCSWDKSVKIWCTTTRACLSTLWTGTQKLSRVAVSQEGGVVAVWDGTALHLVQLSTGVCVASLPAPDEHPPAADHPPATLALSTCGRWVFMADADCVQVTATATATQASTRRAAVVASLLPVVMSTMKVPHSAQPK